MNKLRQEKRNLVNLTRIANLTRIEVLETIIVLYEKLIQQNDSCICGGQCTKQLLYGNGEICRKYYPHNEGCPYERSQEYIRILRDNLYLADPKYGVLLLNEIGDRADLEIGEFWEKTSLLWGSY